MIHSLHELVGLPFHSSDLERDLDRLNAVKSRVQFKGLLQLMQLRVDFTALAGFIQLHLRFVAPCSYTGRTQEWRASHQLGGLPEHITDDEILQIIYLHAQHLVLHELGEGFTVDGLHRPADPHVSGEPTYTMLPKWRPDPVSAPYQPHIPQTIPSRPFTQEDLLRLKTANWRLSAGYPSPTARHPVHPAQQHLVPRSVPSGRFDHFGARDLKETAEIQRLNKIADALGYPKTWSPNPVTADSLADKRRPDSEAVTPSPLQNPSKPPST